MSSCIDHVAVLIPARNEEELLPLCIESVLIACAHLPATIRFEIVVAVDSSTDATLSIARAILGDLGQVVETEAGNVGIARFLAAAAALDSYSGDLRNCWIANTDADCKVPPSWLVDQLELANSGVEAIAGTVDVKDFSEHLPDVERLFRASYVLHGDGTHPHVHGANIGIRADVYLKAGGWSPRPTAEDHDLWRRLTLSGCRKQSVSRLRVVTSGRRIGRAPDGFAGALAAHNKACL